MTQRNSNVHRSSRLAIRQGVRDEASVSHVAVQSGLHRSLLMAAYFRAYPQVGRVTPADMTRAMARNVGARASASRKSESDYHGEPGSSFVPNSVPLGELLAAGHGAVMGAADRRFVDVHGGLGETKLTPQQSWEREATRLTGIQPELSATSEVDSGTYQGDGNGDYRVRYFSASEGMTDTMAENEAPVATERGVPAWVAELMAAEDPEPTVIQEWRRTHATPAEGDDDDSRVRAMFTSGFAVEHTELATDTHTTYMDARWALEKDAYLGGQAYEANLLDRPLEEGRDYGDYAAYAAWRTSRVHRLKAYARKQGQRGRAALRGTRVGPGYVAALDALATASRTIRQRRAKAIACIVRRPGRDIDGTKVLDWHLSYLTTAQHDEVQACIATERSRLQVAYRQWESMQLDSTPLPVAPSTPVSVPASLLTLR